MPVLSRSCSVLVGALLALAGWPAQAGAQGVGSEFRVNTYTSSGQRTARFGGRLIASDVAGNFVVLWKSNVQDGSGYGVFGQRYNSSGGKLGAEFRVNSYTPNAQGYAAVATNADGDFVVVWDTLGQDGSSYGVFGQRYNGSGGKVGSEFRVNTHTTSHQRFPSVASDAVGNFVVVWNSYQQDGGGYGVFGQRYDSAGAKRGAEFRVNAQTAQNQRHPSIASDALGNFVVVWNSYQQDGSGYGVFGRRYNSGGAPQGGEFRVNSHTTSQQKFPSVASDPFGDFVVVWNSYQQDGSGYGIFAQRYNSAGVKLGGEFRTNTFTARDQWFASVASDATGNFVVAWHSELQDGSNDGVFGRRYNSGGAPQGGEFRINTHTASYQLFPSVAARGPDEFVVAWESLGQDGSSWGVYGQRYSFGGGGSTIHSGDLDGRVKDAEGRSWRAQVKATVHDDGHAPESGVLVSFNVSGVGTRTCTTAANGGCDVSVLVSDLVPAVTFTVTNLTKSGFAYNQAANHDPDGDSNGTSIELSQP